MTVSACSLPWRIKPQFSHPIHQGNTEEGLPGEWIYLLSWLVLFNACMKYFIDNSLRLSFFERGLAIVLFFFTYVSMVQFAGVAQGMGILNTAFFTSVRFLNIFFYFRICKYVNLSNVSRFSILLLRAFLTMVFAIWIVRMMEGAEKLWCSTLSLGFSYWKEWMEGIFG
jgi:hypothetical protein